MKNSVNLANDEEEKAKFGYQMAVKMVGILGQEIYSRFNAMLTANSIIIAVYVLIFSENRNGRDFFKISLPVFGIVLCFLWLVFIINGIYRQRQYRNEAKRIEEAYFKSSFRLLRIDYSKDPCLLKCFRFKLNSILVICIFITLHLIVLYIYVTSIFVTIC